MTSTRLFVGFSSATLPVVSSDVSSLFDKMGSFVSAAEVSFHDLKKCAHVSVEGDKEQVEKCIKVYNNTKWKGGTLTVELAKPDYKQRLAKEIQLNNTSSNDSHVPTTLDHDHTLTSSSESDSAVADAVPSLSKKQARRMKRLVRSKQVIEDKKINVPVTELNWKERKDSGWKLMKVSKRPVLVVKTRMSVHAKKMTKIDPTKHFNKLQKLYPRLTIRDPSVTKLEWPGIPHNPKRPTPPKPVAPTAPAPSSWTKSDIFPARTPHRKWVPAFLMSDDESGDEGGNASDTNHDREDDLKPEELVVDEDLAPEREFSMNILKEMLGMVTVNEETRALHAPVLWKETVRFDPDAVGAEMLLRDEDEVYEDLEEGEGVVGGEEMQVADLNVGDIGDAIADTDASANADMDAMEDIPSGIVDSTVQGGSYVVNTNLRSLVFGEDDDKPSGGMFSWLGGSGGDDMQQQEEGVSGPGMLGDSIRERVGGVIKSSEKFSLVSALGIQGDSEMDAAGATLTTPGDYSTSSVTTTTTAMESPVVNFGSTSLFFFHFEHPEIAPRTLFVNDEVFMRHDSMERITQEWEDNRTQVTLDFKKKHRSATRRRTRMVRAPTQKSLG
ncbi:hypothetical protein HDU98_002978 [Podochytrium sp. JEL0797]|nr:hypothetical protein HDU98_002978 [Podochytrium sp. JEL0797]